MAYHHPRESQTPGPSLGFTATMATWIMHRHMSYMSYMSFLKDLGPNTWPGEQKHLWNLWRNTAGWWLGLPIWKIWVRQLGWWFPIYGKNKHVPNHQPDRVTQTNGTGNSSHHSLFWTFCLWAMAYGHWLQEMTIRPMSYEMRSHFCSLLYKPHRLLIVSRNDPIIVASMWPSVLHDNRSHPNYPDFSICVLHFCSARRRRDTV